MQWQEHLWVTGWQGIEKDLNVQKDLGDRKSRGGIKKTSHHHAFRSFRVWVTKECLESFADKTV